MSTDALLPPTALRRRCDPASLPFATTAELAPLAEPLGQERAIAALRFGVAMRHHDYNVFVCGPEGVGRMGAVRDVLTARAAAEPRPDDLCYVHHFQVPQRPRLLRLPAGRGRALVSAADALVGELRACVPAVFESEDFQHRKQAIEEEARRRPEEAIERLRVAAALREVAVVRTPTGFVFAPLKNREPLSQEEFDRLSPAEQTARREAIEGVQRELAEVLSETPKWERERRTKLREVVMELTAAAVRHALEDLHPAWADVPAAAAWLREVESDAVEHAEDFVRAAAEGTTDGIAGQPGALSPLRRYRVLLFVDHAETQGAPVVQEDHPTHANLVGHVDHVAMFGALLSDFLLLRPGAIQRANGGYLVVDALRLLQQPYAWDELKRTLRARECKVGSLARELGFAPTMGLEPEPLPLDLKVIVVGDRRLYHLLAQLDPDFPDLFKIPAEFDDDIPWTPESALEYARLVATVTTRERLHPFDRDAVALLLEEAARVAEDGRRLSVHQQWLHDRMREADHLAVTDGAATVAAAHVARAFAQRVYFAERVRERMYDQVARGIVRVEVSGARVGQVNGLSVLELAGFRFGLPSRITCRTRLGRGQVVDIEREVKLGGPLHSKGVLILGSLVAARYLPDEPPSLAASLTFEQSYGGVEGDSASCAELCALLSSLADVPLRQGRAITGSIDQRGQVQPIGGVTEKVEGFYDVCRARGLDGEQGVLVPRTNVDHLMLREDVVAAVAAGQFHVWAIDTADEALELLTGLPAGERGEDGSFPEGSVNRRVVDTLRRYALAAKEKK